MTLVLLFWVALATATIALAIYRKVLARSEDTEIHLTHGGGALVQDQVALAEKLNAIDKWGKVFTVITFALGLGIAGVYIYEALRAVPLS